MCNMLRDMPLFVKPIFRDSWMCEKSALPAIKKMTSCLSQGLSFLMSVKCSLAY